MEEKLCYYMLTYFSKKPEDAIFKPSGIIVNQSGTDRFDFRIDDIATEEVVGHYVNMTQQGLLSSNVEDPKKRAIATLRSNLADRLYSGHDKSTQFGNVYQLLGHPVDVMDKKYDEFVVAGKPHPKDSL